VSNLLDESTTRSRHVKELYEDKDGYVGTFSDGSWGWETDPGGVPSRTFAEETESMRGRAVFTSFYEQLKSVRAFHHKYPNTVVSHEPSLADALNPTVAVRLYSFAGL